MGFVREGCRLVTSNRRKLAEFRRFGLPIEAAEGVDLPEIDAAPVEVVLHKAKAAGRRMVVEDTTLDVEGRGLGANVRWLMAELPEMAGRRAIWTVLLGANDGASVHVFRGTVSGRIVRPTAPARDAFGFDPVFEPDGAGATLQALDATGEKDGWSARRRAVEAFLSGEAETVVPLDGIPDWTGAWQGPARRG